VLWVACQLIGGFIYGHLLEWAIHKYILHDLGKKKTGPLSFHFSEHHRNSRKNGFYDAVYEKLAWDAGGKELLALMFLVLPHLLLINIAPWFVAVNVISAIRYHTVHKRAHLDPSWAKEHLPWHYDHHMGANQDANWGVRSDWVDRAMGTRIIFMRADGKEHE